MQFQFDASRVPPAEGRGDPVPKDWYVLQISDTEIKATNNNLGQYLNIEFTIADGPYKGRKLFNRHNTQNQNQQAVEIGYREISALCHAVGVLQLQDTQQLHGRLLEGRVTVRPAEGQYEETNEIKAYRACNSGRTAAGNGGSGAAPSMGAAPAGGPPWQQGTPRQQQMPFQQPAQQAPQFQQPAQPGNVPPWQQNTATPVQQAAPVQSPAAPVQSPAANGPVSSGAGAPQGGYPQQAPQGNGAAPWQQPQGGYPANTAPMQAPQNTAPMQTPAQQQVPPWQQQQAPAQQPMQGAPVQQAPSAPQQGNVPPWMQQR